MHRDFATRYADATDLPTDTAAHRALWPMTGRGKAPLFADVGALDARTLAVLRSLASAASHYDRRHTRTMAHPARQVWTEAQFCPRAWDAWPRADHDAAYRATEDGYANPSAYG